MVMALELRLNSPAGTEPNVYKWPLTSGRGAVSVCFSLLTCIIWFWPGRSFSNNFLLIFIHDLSTIEKCIKFMSSFTGQNRWCHRVGGNNTVHAVYYHFFTLISNCQCSATCLSDNVFCFEKFLSLGV